MSGTSIALKSGRNSSAAAGAVASNTLLWVEHSPAGCILPGVPYPVHRKNRAARRVLTGQAPIVRETGLRLASEILQSFLDAIAICVRDDRFEDYARSVKLPLVVKTSAATLTVATLADLEEGFDEYCDMLRWRGVTRMVPTVIEARFEQPESLVGVYRTVMLGGDRPVIPPYFTRIWLQCDGDTWQATRMHNNTNDPLWPLLLNRVTPVDSPPEELLN
jgi:hypothetical protein